MKKIICTLMILFSMHFSFAQNQAADLYKKITSEMSNFKVDTTPVPEDHLTAEIRKLREIKGGFNINEAILFNIKEQAEKGDISAAEAQMRQHYFQTGKGKTDLENAVIHVYRDTFTLPEIRALTKFYNSSAGKKYSENFPLIMVKTLKAAEEIGKAGKANP